jgi:hypothetical protein
MYWAAAEVTGVTAAAAAAAYSCGAHCISSKRLHEEAAEAELVEVQGPAVFVVGDGA